MNRFQFLGSQKDETGQGWCYILDTKTGKTLKSPVSLVAGEVAEVPLNAVPAFIQNGNSTAGRPSNDEPSTTGRKIPEGFRPKKVPPAFMGDLSKMYNDPSKGLPTDITPAV